MQRYAFAVAVTLAATAVTAIAMPLMAPGIFVVYLCVVALTAWYGGFGPALVSIVLSALLATYFFVEPIFTLSSRDGYQRIISFVLLGIVVSWLSELRLRAERKARRSERSYRAVMEQAKVGIVLSDEKGIILEANTAAAEMLGYTPDELKGMDSATLIDPLDLERNPSNIPAINDGKLLVIHRRLRHRDGSYVSVEGNGSRLSDGRLIGIWHDVTERERMERALRESEARYALLTEAMPQIVWTVNPDGYLDYYNRRWYEYTGMSDEDSRGWGWQRAIHPEDLENSLDRWRHSLRTGELYEVEYRIQRSDGAYRWHLGRALPLKSESGQTIKWFGTSTDIDDYKRAEIRQDFLIEAGRILGSTFEYRRALSEMVRLAVPSVADACHIDLVDDAGRLVPLAVCHVDAELEKKLVDLLHHYRPNNAVAHGRLEAVRSGQPELMADVTDEFLAYIAGDEEQLKSLRELMLRSVLIAPIVIDERVVGTITMSMSTSARRYDLEDRDLAEELARRAATSIQNARLYQDAEAANQAKDHFLAVLSHELRTPLTPALAAIQALREEPVPSSMQHLLELMQRNIELEAHLIDDLLDLTRITRGKLQLEMQPVDVRQILHGVCDMVSAELREKQIAVAFELRAERHHVLADAARLQQVFWNLVKNAIKFTPLAGAVTIRIEERDDSLIITIDDTGIGIESELLASIFNPFEQGERTITRGYGGLGLGLAISKSLIEMHGGKITASSSGRDQGSSFAVELRALADPVVHHLDPAPDVVAGEHRTRKRYDVLLVDDHVDTVDVIRLLLERRGYNVATASSVGSALAEASRRRFDLLISDIGLPDGDGTEIVRELRRLHGDVKAIALSGFGMEEDIRRSREAGFTEHLVKPVDAHRLQEAISKVLQQGITS